MTCKPGRNDPCPCGSGKKYKHCCGSAADEAVTPGPARGSRSGGVQRAIDWLINRHRKAVTIAIDDLLGDGLTPEEYAALQALDRETWSAIQVNLTEWLLAEGEILVQGQLRRVAEYLLGQGGPLFTVEQRHWIAQLAARPLRLYQVTDVVPGQQLTLCDVFDSEASPLVVRERSGSPATLLGTQIGVRVMERDGHYLLSGAVYPFSALMAPRVRQALREASDHCAGSPVEELAHVISAIIRQQWLAQFVAPTPMPTLIDQHSGESMLLVTDHYRVRDWSALTQALAAQSDVDGNRDAGWNRLIDCEDGQTRSVATINSEKAPDRISVFYKTQRYADDGRQWFESLVGDAVKFLSRSLSDPVSLMRQGATTGGGQRDDSDVDWSPEDLSDLVAGAIRRAYAHWADEPIPALNGQTPRQAIQTPAGLERVKGLLRTYQASEKQSALKQKRPELSYEFLWQELGISP